MEVDTKEFVLTGRPEHGGFNLTFLRVTPKLPAGSDVTPPSGQGIRRLSLFLLHCVNSRTSIHHVCEPVSTMDPDKETWVPALQHLFELQSKAPNNRFTVVEAWSMDAPSHGHSAVLNESKLYKYPDGIGQCSSHPMQTIQSYSLQPRQWRWLSVGRKHQTLPGLGPHLGRLRRRDRPLRRSLRDVRLIPVPTPPHSHPAPSVQTTAVYPQDRPPYSSIILVEPPMMTREIYAMAVEEGTVLLRAIEIARTRKDIWASREEARAWFAKRLPWNRWDPRVFDLHIVRVSPSSRSCAVPVADCIDLFG